MIYTRRRYVYLDSYVGCQIIPGMCCVAYIKNHSMLLLSIVVDVVSPSLVNTAIMQAITTGIVAPTLAY
jgi:hypothetical protein